MMTAFKPASMGMINSVYSGVQPVALGALGEISTSTRDKVALARAAYTSSGVGRSKVTSYDKVKSRYDLHSYTAYILDHLSHYPWNENDAAAVAEQLRYLSTKTTGVIGNFFTNNLMWRAKADLRGRMDLRDALKYFYEQSRPGKPLYYQLNSAEKKTLESWYETEEKKRIESAAEEKARARLEAEGYKKADSTGDKLGSGTYYYKNGFKFDVGSDGTMTKIAPSGAKTEYKVGGAEYAKIRDAIREDLKAGTASTTQFKRQRRESAPAQETSLDTSTSSEDTRGGSQVPGGVTEQWWFWPAVGVGTVALGVTGYLVLRKKQ